MSTFFDKTDFGDDSEHREVYVTCKCSDLEHMVRFSYFTDGDEWIKKHFLDDTIYVSLELNGNVPFFTRLKYALKYLFRRGYPYPAMFGETLLGHADAKDIIKFLKEYDEYIEAKREIVG